MSESLLNHGHIVNLCGFRLVFVIIFRLLDLQDNIYREKDGLGYIRLYGMSNLVKLKFYNKCPISMIQIIGYDLLH